jgi:hypothetical protein
MRLLCVLAATIALAAPASAQAGVRAGHVDDPRDVQVPTLDDSQYDDISFVAASYDPDSGSLTIAARFHGTPADPDANRSFPPVDFAVGKACDEAMPLSGTFAGDAYWDGGEPRSGEYALDGDGSAVFEGFAGATHAAPELSADHQTISVTFHHPAFVGQDWRCVAGKLGTAAHGSDDFRFYFDGWAPAPLSPAIAKAEMRRALTSRFGAAFTKARPRWLGCPQEQFGTTDDLPSSLCAAEFRTGRTWRYAEASVVADGPRLVTTIGKVRRYVRAWRNCAKSVLRKARVTGTLATTSRDCSTKPAAQITSAAKRHKLRRRMTISSASLDRAGFAPVSTFRCNIGRRAKVVTALCRNTLGDAFRYTFALNRI